VPSLSAQFFLALRLFDSLPQQLQAVVVEAGADMPAVETDCPNAIKAWTPRKVERLNALSRLIVLAQLLMECPVLESLHRLFATSTEYKFSFLNTRKNLRMSAPQYTQRQLF
jgi:hypothetical protein